QNRPLRWPPTLSRQNRPPGWQPTLMGHNRTGTVKPVGTGRGVCVATDPDGAQPNRDELLPDGPEPGPSHTPAEDQNPPLSEKSVSAANDSDRPEPRSCAISACEPYREVIELGLSRGRNAMAIWQDLVSQHGFAHQYGSVKRWV